MAAWPTAAAACRSGGRAPPGRRDKRGIGCSFRWRGLNALKGGEFVEGRLDAQLVILAPALVDEAPRRGQRQAVLVPGVQVREEGRRILPRSVLSTRPRKA